MRKTVSSLIAILLVFLCTFPFYIGCGLNYYIVAGFCKLILVSFRSPGRYAPPVTEHVQFHSQSVWKKSTCVEGERK